MPRGRPPALGDAVLALLDDPARHVRLSSAARTFALANDRRATVARFEALYAELRASH